MAFLNLFPKALLLACLLWATPGQADQEADANKLFVQSAGMWDQYQALSPDDVQQIDARLTLLKQIDTNLKSIVADYPESALAVQLVANGGFGRISATEVASLVAQLDKDARCRSVANQNQCIIELALEIAATIKRPGDDEIALLYVVIIQVALGDSAGALTTAKQIEDPALRLQAEATAGDIAGALKTASAFDDVQVRNLVHAVIAVAQIKGGDRAGAMETFGKIPESASFHRNYVTRQIALEQAAAGDLPGAFKTLADIDRELSDSALSRIAMDQAVSGDMAAALETVNHILGSKDREKASIAIAKAQIAAGDLAGALKTAETIRNRATKAQIQIAAGDNSPVEKARESPVPEIRASVLAFAGDLTSALETADAIEDIESREPVLRAVAQALALAGNISEANRVAAMITDPTRSKLALADIASAQVGNGDILGALQTAKRIDEEPYRARILFAVGEMLDQ